MRILPFAAILSLGTCLPVLAALPPQYQRQAELAAIINDMDVVEAFGVTGIEAIEWIRPDQYSVRGGPCTLAIGIEDAPSRHGAGWVGPREFTLAVGELVCDP